MGSVDVVRPVSYARGVDENRRNILWEHTSPTGPDLTSLSGAAHAEVAVIGAGIAGLSCALHLAEAGVNVTVLEGDQPGAGATGRSGGLVAPDLVRHKPSDVEKTLGPERGRRLVHMVGSSAAFLFDLIEKYEVNCEANQGGFWTPAHNRDLVEAFRMRAGEWQERGFPVSFVDEETTAEQLGTHSYLGALRFDEGGTINPLALTRGLASAALQRGARIYSSSRVCELVRQESIWKIKTQGGALEAEFVVLAANGGNPGLHPALRRTVLPLDVIEYATEPLSVEQRKRVLKGRASFTDKRPYIFTARYDIENRLIAAFPDSPIPRSRSALVSEAAARIGHYFPELKGIGIQYLWPGQAWINTDLLPKVYEVDESLLAIQSCNGRGIATNALIGSEVARAIASGNETQMSVPPEQPVSIPAYPLMRLLPSSLMFAAHLRNRLTRLFCR